MIPWVVRPVVSDTKARSRMMLLPEAQLERVGAGARGILEVVTAPTLRSAEGLSLLYEGEVPVQPVLLKDGDAAGPLPIEPPTSEAYDYLGWLLPQLAYGPEPPQRVFLIGSGGGSEIVRALRSGAEEVWVSEPVRLFRRALERHPAGRDSRIHWWHESPRDALARAERPFDLVQVTATGSSGEAAIGVHSAEEQFSTTVESIRACLTALDEDGVLLMARWRQDPPRETVKLVRNVLRATGLGRAAASHVVRVETWAMDGLLVRPRAWRADEIARLRDEADRRGFELVVVDGAPPSERPGFPGSVQDGLRGYDLRATTDTRPYLGWTGWGRPKAAPEVGVVAAVQTFVQTCAVALLLLAAPVFTRLGMRRRGRNGPFTGRGEGRGGVRGRRPGAATVCVLFAGLGAGFGLFEMGLIQRWQLYAGDPVVALGMVIGGLLTGSGIGALLAGGPLRRAAAHRACVVAAVTPWLVVMAADPLLGPGSRMPDAVQAAVGFAMLVLAGIPLGVPFPLVSRRIRTEHAELVPWIWSANGALSVLGATAAPILLAAGGVWTVFGTSASAYGLAAVSALWLGRPLRDAALPRRG
jgi:hypothetical protein